MKNLNEEKDFKEKILRGLRLSLKRLIEHKKKNGFKFVISKDGKIQTLSAEELEKTLQD